MKNFNDKDKQMAYEIKITYNCLTGEVNVFSEIESAILLLGIMNYANALVEREVVKPQNVKGDQ